jgi:ubiquinone/menaquinone biosynthesis C-methylase UbiE
VPLTHLRQRSEGLRRSFIVALALCAFVVAPCCAQDSLEKEAEQLATLLKWHSGEVVAEIGAGNGKLTLAAAQRVGPSGKVYTTELDANEFARLQQLAADNKNIVAVKAGETDTNLPATCCDSIFMRLVYHHLTKPDEIDASLFRSLKPEGRLGVIDEDPPPGSSIPEGVPKNRIGHGIPEKILISELTAAGFKVETVQNNWPSHDAYHHVYCVVFLKAKR